MNNRVINNRKSQIWTIDLMVGLLIFVMAVSFYYRYASNQLGDSSSIQDLTNEGKIITSSLASPGYPINWTGDTVIRLGIADNKNNIDHNKIIKLLNISYPQLKSLLNTRYDFYVFISDSRGCLIELDTNVYGFGDSGVVLIEGDSLACDIGNAKNMSIDLGNTGLKKLAKIERFVIYNNKIAKMVTYIWA